MYEGLEASSSFLAATEKQRRLVCNGAGPAGAGWVVPDTLWGLSITASANIHDWDYAFGREQGLTRQEVDKRFLRNMYAQIDRDAGWANKLLKPLRQLRARSYYRAVAATGSLFWA